jgi:hypothetical protein
MRLVTVKGRELAPSAATKAGARGGHEVALADANGEGPAIRRRELELVPEAGRPRRPRSRCQFCDRLECQFDDRPRPAAGAPITAGRRLRVHTVQAVLAPPLPRDRRVGFRVRGCCVGSSAGLMAMLVVLGVMSVGWMAVMAVLVTAQKLLPPRAALDMQLALAIVAFGALIIVDPSAVRGLTPPM